MEPESPASPALAGRFFTTRVSGKLSITWKERKKVKSFSHVPLFVTPWTITNQDPLSMGFSRHTGVGCIYTETHIFAFFP